MLRALQTRLDHARGGRRHQLGDRVHWPTRPGGGGTSAGPGDIAVYGANDPRTIGIWLRLEYMHCM